MLFWAATSKTAAVAAVLRGALRGQRLPRPRLRAPRRARRAPARARGGGARRRSPTSREEPGEPALEAGRRETAVEDLQGLRRVPARRRARSSSQGVGAPAFQAEAREGQRGARRRGRRASPSACAKVELKKGDDSHVLGPERYQKLLARAGGARHARSPSSARWARRTSPRTRRRTRRSPGRRSSSRRVKASELFEEAARDHGGRARFVVDKKLVTVPTRGARPSSRRRPPSCAGTPPSSTAPGVFEERPLPGVLLHHAARPFVAEEGAGGVRLAARAPALDDHPRGVPGPLRPGPVAPARADARAEAARELLVRRGLGPLRRADDASRRASARDEPREPPGPALRRAPAQLPRGGLARRPHDEDDPRAGREALLDRLPPGQGDRPGAGRASGRSTPGTSPTRSGKIQILALREEAKKRLGSRFSLQRFHDALLAHGAPPVALIRDRVLRQIGAAP